MSFAAIFKPSLQVLPSLQNASKIFCRNIVSWAQHSTATKNSLIGQLCCISKPMCNTNVSLIPNNINVISTCGMRVKGKPTLRCKDCWYYQKDGRLYVFCDTHPRHKQMSLMPRRKYQWILSHACMSKERPY